MSGREGAPDVPHPGRRRRPGVARSLVDLLALHDHAVEWADSGERALELLDPRRVRPRDAGPAPARDRRHRDLRAHPRALRSLAAGADAHGLPEPGSLRQAYEAGADDFLQKPVDHTALILKVRAFLRLKSLHDETERHRERAQARARDLALLHEIGRDWSLIAEPEAFNRMVTQRLASLIGSSVCLMVLVDPQTRELRVALPAHGLSDEEARALRFTMRLEHPASAGLRSGRAYAANAGESDPRRLRGGRGAAARASRWCWRPMLSEGTLHRAAGRRRQAGRLQRRRRAAAVAVRRARPRRSSAAGRSSTASASTRAGWSRPPTLVGELGSMVARSPLLALFTVARSSPTSATSGSRSTRPARAACRAARPRRARVRPASPVGRRADRLVAARHAPAAVGPRRVAARRWRCPCAPASAALGVLEVVLRARQRRSATTT